jgi:hypothetical protein
MSTVQERYSGKVVAANSTTILKSSAIAGFLCKTGGTFSVVGATSVTIVDAHPVTAGVYYPVPLYLEGEGGTFTTAGGASGTLLF